MKFPWGRCMPVTCFCMLLSLSAFPQTISNFGYFHFRKKTENILSLHQYPSSLAAVRQRLLGVLAEQPYGLEGMQSFYAGLAAHTTHGSFAFLLQQQGNQLNSYQKFSLAYARQLGSRFDAGLQFNLHRELFAGYGNRKAISGSLGCSFQLGASLFAGLSLQDPFFFLPEESKTARINSRYLFFMAYDFSDLFQLGFQFVLTEGAQASSGFSFHYSPHLRCKILAGINTFDGSMMLGVSYAIHRMQLQANISQHSLLGPSPAFGITHLGKEDEP